MSTPPPPYPGPEPVPGPGQPGEPPTYPPYPPYGSGPPGDPAGLPPTHQPYGAPEQSGYPGYQTPGYQTPGYQGPGYPAYPAAGQPSGSPAMAIIAFVLALIACFVISWFVSIGLAIAALVRSRKRPNSGRGWAIAALAIDALWFVGTVAFFAGPGGDAFIDGFKEGLNPDAPRDSSGQITERAEISANKLRVGDCLDDPVLIGLEVGEESEQTTVLDAVPCGEEHQLEVFGIIDLAGEDYPGVDEVTASIEQSCKTDFKDYVGVGINKSKLSFYYYYPSSASWNFNDDHRGTCMVAEADSSTIGSLKGIQR